MTRLLVSVRSVTEADIALAGGADVIDIKEPMHGSLGRASNEVIDAIQVRVAGRLPLSAALGELLDGPVPPDNFSGFVKVGLAGCAHNYDWPDRLTLFRSNLTQSLVLVAYADWQRAAAPDPRVLPQLASTLRCSGLLVDTWLKDAMTLHDWMSSEQLNQLRAETARRGLFLALAGSLRLEHIPSLLTLGPDILAFRGAACRYGQRGAELAQGAVMTLADAIHGPSTKLTQRTSPSGAAALGNQASTRPCRAQTSGPVP